ncbi:OmpA family protein [Oecophyllibacter saccharovorans]|uniref:OmpA-like domain-containing protein n=1 Tax=Oecophyllibacter saccharovorans TaxID=2558360 RepID=A0A506UQJ3_9PROT|nr:OmpA family protein [Oecophyllibacter saccharovorans]TPW34693.1 hypothetical protein E3203_03885 [Oecophyllibacter saccharovorans]TPW35635.1 hypothetical protein E3202_01315 [Oecophyllibacter saccharovorans]
MSRLSVLLRRLCTLTALPVAIAGSLAGCTNGPARNDYVVFFQRDSVTLDPTDLEVIREAADAAHRRDIHHLVVSGSAGRYGDPYVLKELADTRAKAVATMLQQDGIPAQDITMGAFAPTQLEASRVALRRVTIQLDPR